MRFFAHSHIVDELRQTCKQLQRNTLPDTIDPTNILVLKCISILLNHLVKGVLYKLVQKKILHSQTELRALSTDCCEFFSANWVGVAFTSYRSLGDEKARFISDPLDVSFTLDEPADPGYRKG